MFGCLDAGRSGCGVWVLGTYKGGSGCLGFGWVYGVMVGVVCGGLDIDVVWWCICVLLCAWLGY